MLAWAGGSFDAHALDPRKVKFDDPRERWKIVSGGGIVGRDRAAGL